MERDDQTIKGWRKYKHQFTFGKAAEYPAYVEPMDDETYKRESLGFGCSRTVIDFDKLDQQ